MYLMCSQRLGTNLEFVTSQRMTQSFSASLYAAHDCVLTKFDLGMFAAC